MFTTRRFALLAGSLLTAVALALLGAASASADVTSAIDALKAANLYVDPAAGATLDRSASSADLNGNVKIAVLATGDPGSLADQIGSSLDPSGNAGLTVGVFVGHQFDARSSRLCKGRASSLAAQAVSDNSSQLKANNDLTNTIKDFAKLAEAAPGCSSANGSSTAGFSASRSSNHNGWIAIGVLALLCVGGVGGAVGWRRRRDRLALADARAGVQPYFDRLAADVGSLQPGDNPVARQALADASERFNSAGSQLSGATRPAQVAAARRSVLEGLQAARTARGALGLDLGPDLPPMVSPQAPQLTEAQQFDAGGRQVQGYPAYTPGAPYYFAGGGGYAGGWYSYPFWETLLIAEALSPGWGFGGWGGGWGGGGYDNGYASGYGSGFDAGQDSGGGGGDWGGGGGGGGGSW